MSNALKARCPNCQAAVPIGESQVGKQVPCPACRQPFEASSVELAISGGEPLRASPVPSETSAAEVTGTKPESQAPSVNDKPGKPLGRLGRFEIRAVLGQGTFGRVYRAYDPQLDREVALKVPTFDPGEKRKVQRFLAEAKSAAKLRHPNIVPTYESGQANGKYYIASQYIDGQPLSKRIQAGRVDCRQAADWIRQLAEALAYAHSEGIVHRDVKPDNIMLDAKGVPQIMDFGLAKRLNEDSAMTTDGSILGTPAYMSPEQARGDHAQIGPASDQYSLGAVLYELLAGQKPFSGPPHAVIAFVIGQEPAPLSSIRGDISRDLEAICQKAMSKELSRRYESCISLAADAARWMRGEVTLARPVTPVERLSRWRRKNPAVASLALAVAGVALAALIAVSAALWHADAARRHADKSLTIANAERQKAHDNSIEMGQLRKLAEDNLAEANKQRAAAEKSAKLAQQRAAEADQAKLEVEFSLKEADDAIAKLKDATAQRKLMQEAQSKLQSEAKALASERDSAITDNLISVYATRIRRAQQALAAKDTVEAAWILDGCDVGMRGWEWKYLHALAKGRNPLRYKLETQIVTSTQYQMRFSPQGTLLRLESRRYLGSVNGWSPVMITLLHSATGKTFELQLPRKLSVSMAAFANDEKTVAVYCEYDLDEDGKKSVRSPRLFEWNVSDGSIVSENGIPISLKESDTLIGCIGRKNDWHLLVKSSTPALGAEWRIVNAQTQSFVDVSKGLGKLVPQAMDVAADGICWGIFNGFVAHCEMLPSGVGAVRKFPVSLSERSAVGRYWISDMVLRPCHSKQVCIVSCALRARYENYARSGLQEHYYVVPTANGARSISLTDLSACISIDPASGRVVQWVDNALESLAVGGDGRIRTIARQDMNLRVRETVKPVHLEFTVDGASMALCCTDGTLFLYDLDP